MNDNRLEEKLRNDSKKALLAGKKEETAAISYLLSLLQKESAINSEGKISPEKQAAILRKEKKKKIAAREFYLKNDRHDLAEKEAKEIALLQNYLPEEMSDTEVEKIIKEAIGDEKDFGKAMGKAMGRLKGKADGALVARIVRRVVSEGGQGR